MHLTTRQTAADRAKVLKGVRARLKEGAPCRLIATSLIEAGWISNFRLARRQRQDWIESCRQPGRVNREGRKPQGDADLLRQRRLSDAARRSRR